MILACHNINKSFGEQIIVRDGSFHIEEREKAALVGVNGAGKSTIFKMIMGEEPLDGGDVILAKGKVGGMEHLYDELKAGYWVFAFFFSADFYEFKRFETEEDALTYYKSLTRDCFCGQKLLLKVGEAREGLM